jgi:hypothetical protein
MLAIVAKRLADTARVVILPRMPCSSYNLVGADNGDLNVSVFLFRVQRGAGPGRRPDQRNLVRKQSGGNKHSRSQARS